MDQRMALQWVKEHISAFGGDPDQITVFGLSSGATSVATLITDTNAPIFHKAIILSNPFSLIPKSEKTNRQIGTLMAVRVGCLSENQINSTYNGDEVSYCMRQKTPKDLLMASTLSTGIGTESLDGHPMGDLLQYGPTVDNDNVMGRSLDLIINPKPELESRLRNIRLIIGTTRDEMTFSLTPGI
jgi:para-nitrobenzyl esterase